MSQLKMNTRIDLEFFQLQTEMPYFEEMCVDELHDLMCRRLARRVGCRLPKISFEMHIPHLPTPLPFFCIGFECHAQSV